MHIQSCDSQDQLCIDVNSPVKPLMSIIVIGLPKSFGEKIKVKRLR